MGYTVNYSNLEGDAKYAAALNDCQQYLGDKYDTVIKFLREECKSDAQRTLALSFAGITGYPATVLIAEANK